MPGKMVYNKNIIIISGNVCIGEVSTADSSPIADQPSPSDDDEESHQQESDSMQEGGVVGQFIMYFCF